MDYLGEPNTAWMPQVSDRDKHGMQHNWLMLLTGVIDLNEYDDGTFQGAEGKHTALSVGCYN